MRHENNPATNHPLAEWNSIRRWTLTGNGNLRRLVHTPGHVFLVIDRGDSAMALYKDGGPWTTIAVKNSVAEAKAALLPCAEEAQVVWKSAATSGVLFRS